MGNKALRDKRLVLRNIEHIKILLKVAQDVIKYADIAPFYRANPDQLVNAHVLADLVSVTSSLGAPVSSMMQDVSALAHKSSVIIQYTDEFGRLREFDLRRRRDHGI